MKTNDIQTALPALKDGTPAQKKWAADLRAGHLHLTEGYGPQSPVGRTNSILREYLSPGQHRTERLQALQNLIGQQYNSYYVPVLIDTIIPLWRKWAAEKTSARWWINTRNDRLSWMVSDIPFEKMLAAIDEAKATSSKS